MYLYYSLRNLAALLGEVRGEFLDLGNAIRGVWLIGQWLSNPFFFIAGVFGSLHNAADDAAGDWLAFYRWINDNLGIDDRIRDLLRYADDLLSFIKWPFDFIADTIRDYFPDLFEIARDPIGWLLESIVRYTGFTWDLIDNPFQWVRDRIYDIVGDVIDIANNPRQWLIDWLGDIIPDFFTFIFHTRAWIEDRIEDAFPFVIGFLRDPDGFLEEKVLLFIDGFADRYRPRAIKLIEKILQAIF